MTAFKLVSAVGSRTLDLGAGATILVGRAPGCDFLILDPTVSRRHAELSSVSDVLRVRDVGSSGGTFVNGERITEAPLAVGDEVTFGRVSFTVQDEAAVAAPAAVAAAVAAESHGTDRTIVREVPVGLRALGDDAAPTPPRGAAPGGAQASGPMDDATIPLLLDISRDLARQPGVERLLERLADITLQIMNDVDCVSLLLPDPDTGDLVPRVARDRYDLGFSSVPRSIVSRVANEGIAILTDNASADVRFTGSSIVMNSVRSAMSVPLMASDGDVLGVIYVDNRTATRSFGDRDLHFLIAISGIAATALEHSRTTERTRRESTIRSNLERHLDPERLATLSSPGIAAWFTSGRQRVAVVALACPDFAALAAEGDPGELSSLLAAYMREMVAIVFAHGGVVDRSLSGAITAFWGAPEAREDDGDRAVAAAADMRRRVGQLNREWLQEAKPQLTVAATVDLGTAIVCNVGSEERPELAAVGAPFDRARDLCSRADPGDVLITEAALSVCATPPAVERIDPPDLGASADSAPVYRLRQ